MPADLLQVLALAVSTFASEDLACIAAGMSVSSGHMSFASAVAACMSGIFVGDLLLFAGGRFLGRPAVRRAPFRWFINQEAVDRSSIWFQKRGGTIILMSRFIPGTRLPTYFAAGVLRVRLIDFLFYFALAAALWTPLIVGAAWLIGNGARNVFSESHLLLALGGGAILLYCGIRLLLALLTFEGRRRFVGRLKRLKWEFWPAWLAYPPVVVYCMWQTLRFRSPILFTGCNPGIPFSGLVGESKSDILSHLPEADVARFTMIPAGLTQNEKLDRAHAFLESNRLAFPEAPIVIKPDTGERGAGVHVVRSMSELSHALAAHQDLILQEYAGGQEYGVFYVRYPEQESGFIYSITRKIMPVLIGDGQRTLARLILDDSRAVALADHYLKVNTEQLTSIPAKGEPIQLVELGTHAKGAIFLNGAHLITPALTQRIDEISKHFRGFYLGRYDLRVPSEQALVRGASLRILELNGATSEPTHIYDPSVSVWAAYVSLLGQWRMAYEIGFQNRRRGNPPARVSDLLSHLYQQATRVDPSRAIQQSASETGQGGI